MPVPHAVSCWACRSYAVSAGVLVVETIRHVIDHPAAPRDHLAYEFARRGLNETADLVQNNDFTQPLDWDMPKDPNLDKAITG